MIQEIILTREECKSIIDLCDISQFERSMVSYENDTIEVNDCRTSYEYNLKTNEYITNLILPKINKFQIKNLPEYLKIIKYEKGQEFKYHWDNDAEYDYRVKSVSIQLSDNYEGGELNIWGNAGDVLFDKTIGNFIIFDSNLPHQVFPIKSGIRYALVFWLKKEDFV